MNLRPGFNLKANFNPLLFGFVRPMLSFGLGDRPSCILPLRGLGVPLLLGKIIYAPRFLGALTFLCPVGLPPCSAPGSFLGDPPPPFCSYFPESYSCFEVSR